MPLDIPQGYPVCVVSEDAFGNTPEIVCYDTRVVAGWRFCSDVEGQPPLGIFVDYNAPFRFVGLARCGELGCTEVVVQGRAVRKEVARDDTGRAFATGLIVHPTSDGFEPLDQFATSSCSFHLIENN